MLHVIILAAGAGKRMYSKKPKVLHEVGGIPMFQHVLNTAVSLDPQKIHVVLGPHSEQIKTEFPDPKINWVYQEQQLGTGHAVSQALPDIPNNAQVIILFADAPLLQKQTILPLVQQAHNFNLSILVANLANPFGLGRIIRDENNNISEIVEEKDATAEQRQIQEIHTGICCVEAKVLKELLPKTNNANSQQEYYLMDILPFATQDKLSIGSITANDNDDILGVNTRAQLQTVERIYQQRLANTLMQNGVTLMDSKRIDIRGAIAHGQDVTIDINNTFIGDVTIGDNSIIEPNCLIKNSRVGANCIIKSNTVLENCTIADNCDIGPFARIRPGTEIDRDCKIGNFVEIKNTKIAPGSKASHLSYLGDSQIGRQVNIGAGTITCNYDGVNKHKTIIEDGVFIGSDTQIVAPITIGKNATIGAGSTIRKNVPPNELTLSSSTQKIIYGWKRPEKKD